LRAQEIVSWPHAGPRVQRLVTQS